MKWCPTQVISFLLRREFCRGLTRATLELPCYPNSPIPTYQPSLHPLSRNSSFKKHFAFKLGYRASMKRDPRCSVDCVNILHPGNFFFSLPAFITDESLRGLRLIDRFENKQPIFADSSQLYCFLPWCAQLEFSVGEPLPIAILILCIRQIKTCKRTLVLFLWKLMTCTYTHH